MEELKKLIRDVPDFPKPGILFKDITPLLHDVKGLKTVVRCFAEIIQNKKIDRIVGIESRGFIFGAPLSLELGIGFVPVRKPGKLPWTKLSEEYTLEYGSDRVEMHTDAVHPGEKVVIVDDLLATGGTVGAVAKLVEKAGGVVSDLLFVVELDFLKGRDRLQNRNITSLIHY